jgi:hypothetical protein
MDARRIMQVGARVIKILGRHRTGLGHADILFDGVLRGVVPFEGEALDVFEELLTVCEWMERVLRNEELKHLDAWRSKYATYLAVRRCAKNGTFTEKEIRDEMLEDALVSGAAFEPWELHYIRYGPFGRKPGTSNDMHLVGQESYMPKDMLLAKYPHPGQPPW